MFSGEYMSKRLSKNSKIISAIAEFQKTYYYPIVFAALGVISSTFGAAVYVPVIWLLCFSVIFAAIFCDDVKVMLVPIFFVYYSIGCDVGDFDGFIARNDVFSAFSDFGLANLIVCGVLMIGAVVYKLCKSGALKSALKKRGLFTVSFLVLTVVFLLNGAFSPKWQPILLAIGLLESLALTSTYFIVIGTCDKSEGVIDYVTKLTTILGCMIFSEVLILSVKLAFGGELFKYDEITGKLIGLNRGKMVFSWGESNLTGALLAVCSLATLYPSFRSKNGVLYMAAASIMYLGVVFINGRSAILFGGVFIIAAGVLCLIYGKDRKACRIYFAVFMAVVVAAIFVTVALVGGFKEFGWYLYKIFRLENGNSGRNDLWIDGWNDFLSSPVFGVGFLDGGYVERYNDNFYSNMYHNIGVEVIGALGVVGVIAFLLHLRCLGEVVLRKFSVKKLLICFVPLLIIATSLYDNFFFYPNFQIIYGIYVAIAEICLEKDRLSDLEKVKKIKADKPRVVFTYVEAGKGHITPIKAISQTFKAKYGDRVDVCESFFYTETNDKNLVNFENGFKSAVEAQNKCAVVGGLCKAGNLIAGDCLAQRFLMQMTPKGVKSISSAVKHLEDLNADLLVTAHWATTYYANKLKNRPYTIMFCPDSYLNGMFNMDCNDLLISTESGKKVGEKQRLYAGGSITKIPFPIASDAFSLLDKKQELIEKYNVKDSFVVTLSDGGYGMAKLEKTVKILAKSSKNLLVFALCGTNGKLYERLKNLQTSPTVRVVPVAFTDKVLEYLAISDVYVGKSGANSMAEPAFFGVPVIITKCITYIEKGIKKYYVDEVGGALYIPNVKKAVKTVERFAENESERKFFADKMAKLRSDFGAEAIADLIYDRVVTQKNS